MPVYCGIDWAEDHHDVALVDEQGRVVAQQRVEDDAQGYRDLLELLVEHGDCAEAPVPVAIQTRAACW